MPGTITALVAQKKNPDRVNVYLDGKFAFGLAAIEAVRLKRGQVLTDDDIDRLQAADDVEQAFVADPARETGHKNIVIDSIEKFLQIQIHDNLAPLLAYVFPRLF